MSFKDYDGSITLGAGLTPMGEGYPLMQTSDIQAEEGGKRLDALLIEILDKLSSGVISENLDGEITEQVQLVEQIKLALQGKMSAVGIESIEKTSTEGLVDTYTITFTDGSITTFNVTNGEVGKSAYKYAKDAGYTGTEAEFGAKLAADYEDSMLGTWVLNDILTAPSEEVTFALNFTANANSDYKNISIYKPNVSEDLFILRYFRSGIRYRDVYVFSDSAYEDLKPYWQDEGFKTIEITKEPDEITAAWIRANGRKADQQHESDARLKTKSKRLADAINEISDKIDEGGANGLSAYEIAVNNGFEGTEQEWLASLVGADGEKGEKGDPGEPGADGKDGEKGDKGDGLEIATTTGTGEVYEATVNGITELKNGVSFVMIPHENNTNTYPKLNVNGSGEINLWRRSSSGGLTSVATDQLKAGRTYRVVYVEGVFGSGSKIWELVDIPKPVADDLTGTVPVANGGVPFYFGQKKGNVLAIGDSGAPEWQEPTGGEIDTSTLATVDKITYMESDPHRQSIGYSTSNGIHWKGERRFYDSDENELCQFVYDGTVPIVAGDNVTFTVDEENQVVKINATVGGSGGADESMVGTWVFNDILDFVETQGTFDLEFISNGIHYNQVLFGHLGPPLMVMKYIPIDDSYGDYTLAYSFSEESQYGVPPLWQDEAYKTIEILSEPQDPILKALIRANAKKQGGSGGGSLQMPQIRFANFQKVELWDEETETLSTRYRFTVENLGGGTLQVGDKLQICCRRKYPNGKKKLRRMADIEITENDLNQRFLKIEVDPEDESVQKWLFRNDRNQSSVTTLSAMYFRLKRVTKYSDSDGMECNAIFSNVEQVWKTYILPCNGGWELNIK